ncbi:spore germination lipoprotein GerD [Pontibacillus litoralis]|uniref:Spore germination protein GerD n=1 Tax=Pontibacillus litoralis JSM 072002 TaxID=1385512 RepID=A0A0A5FZY0_9BACI|nr:spore germination lipoprotein GerD [Pontibacillus litoralis]KGX84375.1 spore germination protein GerD [Pontibacillus litoralis JSM 072002]
MNKVKGLILLASIAFLVACTGNSSSSGDQAAYDTTKKMVVDILKTDDGKKAITEVLKEEDMKKQLALESDVVTKAIEETVTSKKGEQFWSKQFEDPQFSKTFAESMMKEQEKLMKDLMKDPTYQKSMLELLQNPEMEQQMLTVVKSQQFREHLEKTIEETMNTPMFKEKMSQIVLKAAEEMKASNKKQSQDDNKQSEDSGGGSEQSEGSGGA